MKAIEKRYIFMLFVITVLGLGVCTNSGIAYTSSDTGVVNNQVITWEYKVLGVLTTTYRLDIENVSLFQLNLSITADLTANTTKTINDDNLLFWNATTSLLNCYPFNLTLEFGGLLVIPKLNTSVSDDYIETLIGYSSVSHTSNRILYSTALGNYESIYNSNGVLVKGYLRHLTTNAILASIDLNNSTDIIPMSDLVFVIIPISIVGIILYKRKTAKRITV